ncbi:hypothetical protein E2C01_049946 [Portunus trituberculatus]|uniref:Uncharacterized protein n=1 Tax=Portunus trituberculatus TaxID=210409 RepID=A0A5B7GFB9_PORTR|nr:hypothetical protein [Portunus trituberculatus]
MTFYSPTLSFLYKCISCDPWCPTLCTGLQQLTNIPQSRDTLIEATSGQPSALLPPDTQCRHHNATRLEKIGEISVESLKFTNSLVFNCSGRPELTYG